MNGIAQTGNADPLKDCINHLISAMRADYSRKFEKRFDTAHNKDDSENNLLRQYKRRLYSKLKKFKVEFIYEAYDLYVDEKNKFVPDVPDLLDVIERVEKTHRQEVKNQDEVDRMVSLPKPTIQCDPVALLKKAKTAASGKDKKTKEEWLRDKEALRINNNAVINIHNDNVISRHADEAHLCKFPPCRKSGSLTHSTTGSENWYCQEHFQMS